MDERLLKLKGALAAFLSALGAFLGWKGSMLLAWAVVMGLDYVSGTMAACKAGKWNSATAREGLWHKGGMILVVTVAAIADGVMTAMGEYLPLEFRWPGVLLPMVLAWYILTELGSVLENAVELGANVPGWLVKLLKNGVQTLDRAADEG